MTATLRYMGSKRSLAPAIADLISTAHPRASVADAFAGTCAIATTLAPRHHIITNDVHRYAETIARSLLVAPGTIPTVAEAIKDLRAPFRSNFSALEGAFEDRLKAERRALAHLGRPNGWLKLRDFTAAELEAGPCAKAPALPKIDEYRASATSEPFALFSLLYPSTYFGVKQAAEIDSLRFAVTHAAPERQDFYMSALLHTLSHVATAPGHFAQFLVPRDEKNTRYIARMRARSIWNRFLNALVTIDQPCCLSRKANRVYRQDAVEFATMVLPQHEGELVVYADPPYSRAQYSRYYHVLETLVLYNYPETASKGRYPKNRFYTDFSRRSGVRGAMESFVAAVAASGAPLYLSYPRNGLLNEKSDDLMDILADAYPTIEVAATKPLAHSTLGAAPGSATKEVIEDVYYAKF